MPATDWMCLLARPGWVLEMLYLEIWSVFMSKNGQLEVYHPDFRRWMSDTLFTKETFLNDWELKDTRIINIKIEKIELQFFTDSNLSVAHYKVNETLEWIGEDLKEDDFTILTGETWTENYTVSDYFVKEKNEWFYIGGTVKQIN